MRDRTTATPGPLDVLQRVAEQLRRATRASAVLIERGTPGTPTEVVGRAGIALDRGAANVEVIHLRDPHGWTIGVVTIVPSDGVIRRGRRLDVLLELTGVALQAVHVSELTHLQRRAFQETVDEKLRLINGISYELKERLGVASEYVQLLDTETELTERQRDYIASSRRSIAAAVRVIGDLVELARIEAGRMPVAVEELRIAPLLRNIADDYRLGTATFGVALITEVPTDLPVLHTDPELVGRILDTLLSNAVRYTPANGTIRLEAGVENGPAGAHMRIAVIDSGPGVTTDEDVFEAIERVSRRSGAAGFRLAISRSIARLLGGDLVLERTRTPGATFALSLPLTQAGPEADPGATGSDTHHN